MAVNDHKTIVATNMEVNVEKILLLKPDIIITTSLTKPSAIEQLQHLGLKVIVYKLPNSYIDLCKVFTDVSVLLNKQTPALNIIDKQNLRLSQLKKSFPKNKKTKVFFEIGAKPLFTAIPNTFMDDYIKYAGGINIASDLKNGQITKESVLIRNPDVIFIVSMGILTTEEKSMWSSYSNLNAAKQSKIFFIDANNSCSPDPVLFVDVVEQMVNNMYK
jgi:iron complex transport system substrate-binding protein